MADSLKKAKIVVLGDSGVGKSSFVHLICHRQVLTNPSWTVGCNVEVKVHEYGKALSTSQSYFLEFWDMGGSPAYKKGRSIFYSNTNGIILVYDRTNRKSHDHLPKWMSEFHCSQQGGASTSKTSKQGLGFFSDSRGSLAYDPESFADQGVPVMIVGTKGDCARSASLSSNITGAIEINLDCNSLSQLTFDSQQTTELNKFFDKVIEKRYFPSYHMSNTGLGERHRSVSKRVSLN